MAEYIERIDALKICRVYSEHCFDTNDSRGQDIADRIEDDIVALPTSDVAEVVRCKNCRYSYGTFSEMYCKIHTVSSVDGGEDAEVDADDFCSYGERKEE